MYTIGCLFFKEHNKTKESKAQNMGMWYLSFDINTTGDTKHQPDDFLQAVK